VLFSALLHTLIDSWDYLLRDSYMLKHLRASESSRLRGSYCVPLSIDSSCNGPTWAVVASTMVGLFSSNIYNIHRVTQKPSVRSFGDRIWRVDRVVMCGEDFVVLMLETIDNKKGRGTIIVYPLNQTRGMHNPRTHPQNLFTRPPVFPIATSTSRAGTPSPTSFAFRWLPSTSPALSLWGMKPTFEALAMA
jgi:hypothetical protein